MTSKEIFWVPSNEVEKYGIPSKELLVYISHKIDYVDLRAYVGSGGTVLRIPKNEFHKWVKDCMEVLESENERQE